MDATFLIDWDGGILYANEVASQRLGVPLDRCATRSVVHLTADWTSETWRAYRESILRDDGNYVFEARHRRHDGSTFPVQVSARVMEEEGETSIVAHSKDLSERELRRSELQLVTERLESALRSGKIGLWDWDVVTGDVHYAPDWLQQLGEEAGTLNDMKAWESRLHPDDREAARERMDRLFVGTESQYESTFRLQHPSGNYRWILSRGNLSRDRGGKPTRFIGVHIDITENRALTKALSPLNQSNRDLEQFASAASHDLQEPLRAISGYCELLKKA